MQFFGNLLHGLQECIKTGKLKREDSLSVLVGPDWAMYDLFGQLMAKWPYPTVPAVFAMEDCLMDLGDRKGKRLRANDTEFKAWQYEFMYYMNPEMDTSCQSNELHEATLKQMDFATPEAKAFYASWIRSTECIRSDIYQVLAGMS